MRPQRTLPKRDTIHSLSCFTYFYQKTPSFYCNKIDCIKNWCYLMHTIWQPSFLGGSVIRICLQWRRHKRHSFDSWVDKIPLEKEMATHSNILIWENSCLGQRSLEGYKPWGWKESNMTEQLNNSGLTATVLWRRTLKIHAWTFTVPLSCWVFHMFPQSSQMTEDSRVSPSPRPAPSTSICWFQCGSEHPVK